jgi:hypothetical protein
LSDIESAACDHARQSTRSKTSLVTLIAFLIILIGIYSGICFYRQYWRENVQKFSISIPYTDEFNLDDYYWDNSYDGPKYHEDSGELFKFLILL